MTERLLSVENLSMHYPVRAGFAGRTRELVKAVDNVSFSINSGETFGLVGESGCGKTTTGKCVLRINEPTSGRIVFKGQDLAHASRRALAPFRRKLQLIFQDPYSSLDPRQTASSMLAEAITAGGEAVSGAALREKIAALLATVELPEAMGRRYPHEMSGGQRQRLGIARALACAPDLVICDEPVAALDVSIQAQIINLFKSIQKQTGVTYLFIAHDLAVVRHISDRIGVMYLGRLVEVTGAEALYIDPRHPYTKALLSAIPITDYYEERKRSRIVLPGEVPSPMNVPPGCPFHPRCGYATAECRIVTPELRDIGNGHSVACHNA
ncbi:ABC transporter ATP-binding protein [Lichenicola cladoniae]|uniref:ABC transporter ATP-binding protein n=1 Tax=Lichenicola cladoniae TaxID=1484109 RepID=A0A6M8HLJ2_9PROT|nr:ABC transporter ATP-binding protein [Lichenicola cladoniae]NPD66036.1 ABC transporter ATP-binding protein [Acetobacteraceae bacterium]QKE89219.1 ABC transporter ATP-binding protein [Lichenicola cladoniae]